MEQYCYKCSEYASICVHMQDEREKEKYIRKRLDVYKRAEAYFGMWREKVWYMGTGYVIHVEEPEPRVIDLSYKRN